MISRRQFVTGTLATFGFGGSLSFLTSCGSSSSSAGDEPFQVVQRFPQVLVPGSVRIPISLANQAGLLGKASGVELPTELRAQLLNSETGEVVIADMMATRHDANIDPPYWPFRAEIAAAGIYSLVVEGGSQDGAGVQIMDPTTVSIPLIGTPLPGFDTPTTSNSRDVNPLCTRNPEPCPLHDITLNEALKLGKPIAYLVGTPAHCRTGTCSPALDALLSMREVVGDRLTMLHAEIYTDDTATIVAPAVEALNMTYEPALFITDAKGVLVERFDAIFDAVEITEAFTTLGVL
jgi:hypothetical protein